MAGDQHDLRVDLPLAEARQRCQPVHARQPDVEQDQVDGTAREPLEAFLTARHRLDAVAFVAEHAAQGGPHAGLVVDDQDRWFHRTCVMADG